MECSLVWPTFWVLPLFFSASTASPGNSSIVCICLAFWLVRGLCWPLALFLEENLFLSKFWKPSFQVDLLVIIKMMISVGYGYLFIYNSELFPTKFRAFTIGTALFFARICSAITSFAIDLSHILKIHPMVMIALSALPAFAFLSCMPETQGKGLK